MQDLMRIHTLAYDGSKFDGRFTGCIMVGINGAYLPDKPTDSDFLRQIRKKEFWTKYRYDYSSSILICWEHSLNRPGAREDFENRFGSICLPPDERIQAYTDYCKHYHSCLSSQRLKSSKKVKLFEMLDEFLDRSQQERDDSITIIRNLKIKYHTCDQFATALKRMSQKPPDRASQLVLTEQFLNASYTTQDTVEYAKITQATSNLIYDAWRLLYNREAPSNQTGVEFTQEGYLFINWRILVDYLKQRDNLTRLASQVYTSLKSSPSTLEEQLYLETMRLHKQMYPFNANQYTQTCAEICVGSSASDRCSIIDPTAIPIPNGCVS